MNLTTEQKAQIRNALILIGLGYAAYKFTPAKWAFVQAAGAGLAGVSAVTAAQILIAKGA